MSSLVSIRSKAADDSDGGFGQSISVGHAGAYTALEHEMVRHLPSSSPHAVRECSQRRIIFSMPTTR
jgi:hypothetical protein